MRAEFVGPRMRTRRRLSTGHEVTLPLELTCAIGGVVLPARRRRLARVLPAALSPLAIAPGVGCVLLVGIQYHRVGGPEPDAADATEGAAGLEPYDEFGVIVPAVAGARVDLPLVQLTGDVGGYVHWLPVTTDASVALGREIWGYPKERADVAVTDGPDGIRTVVDTDDGRVLRLEVPRVRGREREWTTHSYTTKDGDLVRTRADLGGRIGLRSGIGARLEWGEAAGDLREVTSGATPLASVYGSRVRARLFDGESRRSTDD